MSDSAVTATTIPVEHVRIVSKRSFAEARRRIEALPNLDPGIVAALARGDEERGASYDETGPKLSIFLERDHGALLAIAGGRRHAIQYEIGNPLTASKMTRHVLAAGLYAPLRVILYEADDGSAVIEYDRPSSLFGQFGDAAVTEVGQALDAELESVLREAAG